MMCHRQSTRLILLVILTSLLTLPSVGAAGPAALGSAKAYTIIGTSRIYKNNTANARQEAISNALDIAVATAVAELVPTETLVGHLSAVSQAIEGRSSEYLQGYKVLAEAPSGNNYRVVVDATVSLDALRRQFTSAGVTLSRKPMPRTLFLVVEKNVLQQYPSYWWGGDSVMVENDSQRVLESKLREAGFTVLNPSRPDQGVVPTLDFPPNMDLDAVIQLASAYRAEAVVVGTAQATLAPNTMGDQIRSYRAVMGVKAVRIADRKIIATVEQEAVTTAADDTEGGRKALDLAAVQTGEALAGQLAAAWLVSEDVLTKVEIAIEGTRDLANFVTFRRVLKNMPGVKSIQTTEMKPDQAMLVVAYQGDVSALAEGLLRTTFEPFSIDIYSVADNKMRVAIIPR